MVCVWFISGAGSYAIGGSVKTKEKFTLIK